ncbi:uncharacterized protein PAC_00945 [Phialocephala subalpina]|uniref:Uncharacterized protein n=1 Tax=Phialocephala subalpina TaxID=576137 RepID=A0A1L7WE54_9HELO|nr:uncharacterized protein PAC_00945 [Phialocephala subalpina]
MAPSIYTTNEPPMQSPSRKQAPPPTSAAMNLPPMASPSSLIIHSRRSLYDDAHHESTLGTRLSETYQKQEQQEKEQEEKKTGPELFAHRPPTARPPQVTVNGSSVQLPQDETWENVHAPSTTDKNKSGNQNTPYFNLPIHFPNEVQDKAILRTSSDSHEVYCSQFPYLLQSRKTTSHGTRIPNKLFKSTRKSEQAITNIALEGRM